LAYKIQVAAATAGGLLTAGGALAGEYLAAGHLHVTAGMVADVVGLTAGLLGSFGTHTNMYLSSPTKVAVIGGAEVLLAGGAAVDLFAMGSTSVIGALGVFVGSPLSSCFVSGKTTEMVSILGDIKIEAKKQNIKMEAHDNVTIDAEKKDIRVTAHKGFLFVTPHEGFKIESAKGPGIIYTYKDVQIESTSDKKIAIKAGNSSITMSDKTTRIEADEIELVSVGGKAMIRLAKSGEIQIIGKDITMKGRGDVVIKGKKVGEN